MATLGRICVNVVIDSYKEKAGYAFRPTRPQILIPAFVGRKGAAYNALLLFFTNLAFRSACCASDSSAVVFGAPILSAST